MMTAALLPNLTPDQERAYRAALAVRAVPRACFWNARRLAALGPRRRWLGPLSYVEGWVLDHKFPLVFEHGWCVDAAGQIIDPTLILIGLYDQPVALWRPNDTHAYYPVYTYPPGQIPRFHEVPTFIQRHRADPEGWRTWHGASDRAWRSIFGPAYDEFLAEARRLNRAGDD